MKPLSLVRRIQVLQSAALAFLLQATLGGGQDIGSDFCACQPAVIEVTLDFDLTCPERTVFIGPGIEDVACSVEPRDSINITDKTPATISEVQLLELDQNLDVVGQSQFIDGPYFSGDTFRYTSIVQTNRTLVDDVTLPRGFQVLISAVNAELTPLIHSWVIVYTNDCGIFPLLEVGDQIGWTVFTDLGNPPVYVCPLAGMDTMAPSGPTVSLMPTATMAPTVSMIPTNQESDEPTISQAPTIFASESPTASSAPTTNVKAPSDLPSAFESLSPTIFLSDSPTGVFEGSDSPSSAIGGTNSPTSAFGGTYSPTSAFGGTNSPTSVFGGTSSPTSAFGGSNSPTSAFEGSDMPTVSGPTCFGSKSKGKGMAKASKASKSKWPKKKAYSKSNAMGMSKGSKSKLPKKKEYSEGKRMDKIKASKYSSKGSKSKGGKSYKSAYPTYHPSECSEPGSPSKSGKGSGSQGKGSSSKSGSAIPSTGKGQGKGASKASMPVPDMAGSDEQGGSKDTGARPGPKERLRKI